MRGELHVMTGKLGQHMLFKGGYDVRREGVCENRDCGTRTTRRVINGRWLCYDCYRKEELNLKYGSAERGMR